MDLICPVCAEPLDMAELHDATDDRTGKALDFDQAFALFRTKGCGALGYTCHPAGTRQSGRMALRAEMADTIYEMMGDDVDGAASFFEDMGAFR